MVMSNISKYRPLEFLQGINKEINRFFSNKNWFTEDRFADLEVDHWIPYGDIKEGSNDFVINIDLPGVNLKDIDISIDNNKLLTVKGERRIEYSNKDKGYSKIERVSGTFYRQFSLPEHIDSEQIKASIKDGVLSIIAPKNKDHIVKKIKIEPISIEKEMLEDENIN